MWTTNAPRDARQPDVTADDDLPTAHPAINVAPRHRYAPWRGGHGGVRMGLTPIDQRHWLVDPATIAPADADLTTRLAEKCALFAAQPADVYRELDTAATRAAVAELRAHVERHVRAIRQWSDHATVPALVNAAFNVAEDLCVLLPAGTRADPEGDYRLVAAALFAPSFWRIAEKLGAPLAVVHGPVTNLEARIGPRIRAFLRQLQPGRVFTRGNWNLHIAPQRFHPGPDEWTQAQHLTADNAGARLWIRCERQTLMKLPDTGAIVFTILVFVERLDAVADNLPLLADLWQAFQAMPAAEQADRHLPQIGAALHGWLTQVGALGAR